MPDNRRASDSTDALTAAFVDDFEASGMDEAASKQALSGGDVESGDGDLPSTGLLSFYDRLRRRILDTVERKGGKLGAGTVKGLLLVPDVFMLLARLALDKDVPASTRALVGGALAYFILPLDLMPEALVGVGGYVDDLALAAAVLAHAFSGELEPYARKHWSGPQDLRVMLRDAASVSRSLMGESLYERLRGLLARRGVEIGEEPEEDLEGALDDELYDGETAQS
jgi:uncharacterized membrane protein YkvA (DUF1232 family)